MTTKQTPDPVETLCQEITGESHGAHSWSCGQGKVHFTGCKDGCPSCAAIRAHDERLEERVRREELAITKGLAYHTLHHSSPCNWGCQHLAAAKAFLDRARGEEGDRGK